MRCPFRVRAAFWRAWLRVSVEVFARTLIALIAMLALSWLLLCLLASRSPCAQADAAAGAELHASCADWAYEAPPE